MACTPNLPFGERVYAIGDVHGRYDLLADLLGTIRRDNDARPAAEVRLILVGDLIDRGPASADVVEQCRALATRHDRFIVLKGNHEAVMIDALKGSFPAFTFWLQHGGHATLASWGVPADLADQGLSRDLITAAKSCVSPGTMIWLNNLPLTHQRGNCLFVHAGIRPGVPLAKQAATDLLWIRKDFLDNTVRHPYVVVHGHTVEEAGPCLRNGRLGIDTGAYRTGRLTAVGIEGGVYWTHSTGTSPATLGGAGEIPSIDESVAAILNSHTANTTSSARNRLAPRTLAITSITAALLIIGTVQIVQDRGSASNSTGAPIAVAPPPRPLQTGTIQKVSATLRLPAPSHPPTIVTDSGSAATAEIVAMDVRATPGVAPVFLPRRKSDASYPHSPRAGDRATKAGFARSATNMATLRAPASFKSAPKQAAANPVSRANNPAMSGLSLLPTLDRVPARADEPVVIARPAAPPAPMSENAKERIQAIDAIRSLRRQ